MEPWKGLNHKVTCKNMSLKWKGNWAKIEVKKDLYLAQEIHVGKLKNLKAFENKIIKRYHCMEHIT